MQKQCNKCLQFKPFDSFVKQSSCKKDGLSHYCKSCLNPMKSAANKARYQRIREQQISYALKWQKENPDKLKAYRRKYDKSIRGKLKNNLSKRIKSIIKKIKNHSKSYSCSKYIGCSLDFLKNHLESKFINGMSWENYGEWHIDHIKPLSLFDLSNESQRQAANHFSNLQPLWAKDNLAKGAKYTQI